MDQFILHITVLNSLVKYFFGVLVSVIFKISNTFCISKTVRFQSPLRVRNNKHVRIKKKRFLLFYSSYLYKYHQTFCMYIWHLHLKKKKKKELYTYNRILYFSCDLLKMKMCSEKNNGSMRKAKWWGLLQCMCIAF